MAYSNIMNPSVWNNYKTSQTGKDAIALFTFDTENDDLEERAIEIFQKYNEYYGGNSFEKHFAIRCSSVLNSIIANKLFIEENENASTYFTRIVDKLEICEVEQNLDGELTRVENEPPIIGQKDYRNLCPLVPELSLILYLYGKLFFFPILFKEKFDVFIKIMDVLGIPISDLPSKADKRGRLLLYNDLSENIKIFAVEFNLTPAETCACIYDFATMYLEENASEIELPEPSNIWITGASKEDFKNYLENPSEGGKNVWTCNENTKRGDIVIMYVTSPHSCLQSIWRAEIDGVYTPFNYYNSRIKATHGIVIPHITLAELRADPYLSQVSIVRKSFQGVNGVPLSANDYAEIQRLLSEKGFDVSVLPKLFNPNMEMTVELSNEKDVEEKLLIPLIKKLGYSEADWTRQLSQKAGRKEKAIPDFVFLPKGEKHFQNALMVIEAKFNMSSNIERINSYNQAHSYARMMKSAFFGICDKDILMIFKENKDQFERDKPVFEKHWQSINDPETFSQLKRLIGRDVLAKYK